MYLMKMSNVSRRNCSIYAGVTVECMAMKLSEATEFAETMLHTAHDMS